MEKSIVNGIEDALRQCGVTEKTLTPAEKESLDRQGNIVLTNVIDGGWLARLRTAFESAIGQGRPATTGKQSGTRHVENLAWKDEAFDNIYTHPRVLAAVHHVLGRSFKVFLLSGRDPLPGYGQQGLHNDWLPRMTNSEPYSIVTSIWLLDDFTQNNGATRLIPGSHLLFRPLPKPMQAPESRHPDQKVIIAKAGSVLVFNGHLWHSGTRNESNHPRRVVTCQFVVREMARLTEAQDDIPDRLTPAARYILGV